MKQIKILTAVITVFFFASCRNAENKELMVPKDAITVVHINGASISSKASWKDLSQTDWFRKQKQRTTNSYDQQLMEDPEKSGVDLKSDFVYFTQKKGFRTIYSVFEGKLKNVSDFEKLLSEKNPGTKIEEGEGFRFMPTGSSDLISWTNSKFIYVTTENSFGANKTSEGIDSLKAYAAFVYKTSKENSIETNEKYAALLKESGDIHFWSSTPEALSGLDIGPLPVLAASALMQGSATAGTISFDNGKIVVRSKQYFNSTLSGIIEKYQAKPLTSELLNHVVPNSSIVIAMNYHPQLIKDILRATGTESSANRAFEDFDFRLDDLLQSMKGEMLITASELGPQRPSMEEPEDEDLFPFGGNLLVSMSLNNDSSFKKVQAIIKKQFPIVVTRIQNNWFLAGNSAETINRFFSAGDNSITGKIGGHPFGMYLDLQKGMDQWNVEGLDSSLVQQINLSKSFWQDVVSTGGDYKNGSLHFETTVNLVDKTSNSLKQLGKYSTQMAAFSDDRDYVKSKLFPKKFLLAYNIY